MNPKTLSDDRTFNVGVKQGKAHFVPDQVLLGGWTARTEKQEARWRTAPFAQSSKPNCVLEEGYVPELCDTVTPLS